jgi:hypothetical protein
MTAVPDGLEVGRGVGQPVGAGAGVDPLGDRDDPVPHRGQLCRQFGRLARRGAGTRRGDRLAQQRQPGPALHRDLPAEQIEGLDAVGALVDGMTWADAPEMSVRAATVAGSRIREPGGGRRGWTARSARTEAFREGEGPAAPR